jgi:hypothetical protein
MRRRVIRLALTLMGVIGLSPWAMGQVSAVFPFFPEAGRPPLSEPAPPTPVFPLTRDGTRGNPSGPVVATPSPLPRPPEPSLPTPVVSPSIAVPDSGEPVELPPIRTVVNRSIRERTQALSEAPRTPLYETALVRQGPARPVSDQPPWLPQLAPDVSRRFLYLGRMIWNRGDNMMPGGGSPPAAVYAATPLAVPSGAPWEVLGNPGYRTDGRQSFTWRDWITRREAPDTRRR